METAEPFEEASAEPARTRAGPLDPGTREDLARATEDAGAALEELYRVGNAFIGRKAEDSPYAVLGVAAGIGFVLGGGLAWRMAGRLVNVASRVAIARMIEEWA